MALIFRFQRMHDWHDEDVSTPSINAHMLCVKTLDELELIKCLLSMWQNHLQIDAMKAAILRGHKYLINSWVDKHHCDWS